MSENPHEATKELHQLTGELQSLTAELEKTGLGEIKEKVEKMYPDWEKFEDRLQKQCADAKQAKAKVAELEDTIEELNKKAYRAHEKSADDIEIKEFESFHKKAYDTFVRNSEIGLKNDMQKFIPYDKMSNLFNEAQIKYLRTDVNPDGGFLCPPEIDRTIIKQITEIDPIRAFARVRQVGSISLHMPSRTRLVSSEWEGEGQLDTKDHSKYGKEILNLRRLSVTVPITREELQDAAVDMVSEINSDVAEEYARKEGIAFIRGNGVNEPEGIMINTSIQSLDTAAAGVLDIDDLIDLTSAIKQGYEGRFAFNKNTRGRIMKLKYIAGTGGYIWSAGNVAANIPSTILGEEYFIAQNMDSVATDNYPVVYGDFRRAYLIADRTSMSVIRDEVSENVRRKNMIEFTFHRRVGAMVILAEALKKLKVA